MRSWFVAKPASARFLRSSFSVRSASSCSRSSGTLGRVFPSPSVTPSAMMAAISSSCLSPWMFNVPFRHRYCMISAHPGSLTGPQRVSYRTEPELLQVMEVSTGTNRPLSIVEQHRQYFMVAMYLAFFFLYISLLSTYTENGFRHLLHITSIVVLFSIAVVTRTLQGLGFPSNTWRYLPHESLANVSTPLIE